MKKGMLKSAVLAVMLCGFGGGTGLAATYGVSYEVGGRYELTDPKYESSSVLGNKIYSGGTGGAYNFVTGTVNTIGGTSDCVSENMVYGSGNTVTSSSNSVFGSTNKIGSGMSTVIGEQNKVAHDGDKALTDGVTGYSYNIALGYQNTIGSASNAIAIGYLSSVTANEGIAIGHFAQASGEMAVAIGYAAVASGGATQVGDGTKGNDVFMTTVSFGHQKSEAKDNKTYLARLKNIYEGSDDNDAVNVKQLKAYVAENAGYVATDPITVTKGTNYSTIAIRNMSMGVDATGSSAEAKTNAASIALGQSATASGYKSLAFGYSSQATKTSATAYGESAQATGIASVALGSTAQATKDDTVAVGKSAKATNTKALALGRESEASGSGSIAVGYQAKSNNYWSIAIGYQVNQNTTAGLYSVAIGSTSKAAGEGAVAIGDSTKAEALNSVAIGKGSKATEANTISVGSGDSSKVYGFRRIVNVADGTANTDAATYGQLIKNQEYTFDSSTGIATIETNAGKTAFTLKLSSNGSVAETDSGLISGAKVYAEVRPAKDGNYILTKNTTADNLKALDDAIGSNKDIATTGGTIQNGKSVNENLKLLDGQVMTNTKAISDLSTTVTTKDTELEKKIGTLDKDGNVIKVENNVSQNLAALDNAITSSVTPNVQHLKDITRSEGATATGENSLALGDKSHADGDSSISFGTNATASAANAVSIGTGSTVTGDNSIAVGTGHTVHGQNSGAFGDPDNIHGDNSYSFGNSNVIGDHDAGDGAIGNNTFIVGNHNTVTGDNTFVVGNNVTTSANNAVVLGNNSTATEDGVVSVGSEENQRRIVNVAAGEKDTDAVNVSQLKKAMQGNALEVNDALNNLDQRINKVGAGAAALAALHPETFDPSNKLNFAIGYGHYKNANAGAFGAFYKPNQDTTVSAGSTFGNGNPMVNMGVSFKIGKRGQSLAANASNAELVQEVNHLRAQNNRYEEKFEAQEKKIADLEEKMQKLLQRVGKV